MSSVTDEQIMQIFNLFDADGSNFIEMDELPLALQSLGFGALSKDDVDGLVNDVCPEGTTQVDYASFRKMVRSKMSVRNSIDEISSAFKLFSSNGETITVDDFMRVAQELGELDVMDRSARREDLRQHFSELISLANAADRNALSQQQAGGGNHNGTASLGAQQDGAGEDEGEDGAGISASLWRKVQQESVSDKRHRFVDDGAYSIKTRAKVAKRSPYGVRVEAGKTYYWCSCGMSKNQPFCDGSHAKTNEVNKANFQPVKYVADQTRTVWFCGCKQTKAPPLCDGSHTNL